MWKRGHSTYHTASQSTTNVIGVSAVVSSARSTVNTTQHSPFSLQQHPIEEIEYDPDCEIVDLVPAPPDGPITLLNEVKDVCTDLANTSPKLAAAVVAILSDESIVDTIRSKKEYQDLVNNGPSSALKYFDSQVKQLTDSSVQTDTDIPQLNVPNQSNANNSTAQRIFQRKETNGEPARIPKAGIFHRYSSFSLNNSMCSDPEYDETLKSFKRAKRLFPQIIPDIVDILNMQEDVMPASIVISPDMISRFSSIEVIDGIQIETILHPKSPSIPISQTRGLSSLLSDSFKSDSKHPKQGHAGSPPKQSFLKERARVYEDRGGMKSESKIVSAIVLTVAVIFLVVEDYLRKNVNLKIDILTKNVKKLSKLFGKVSDSLNQ